MGTIKKPSEEFPQVKLQEMHLLVCHQGIHLKYSEVITQARNQVLKEAPQVKPHSWALIFEPQGIHPLEGQHFIPQGRQLRIPANIYHQFQL